MIIFPALYLMQLELFPLFKKLTVSSRSESG